MDVEEDLNLRISYFKQKFTENIIEDKDEIKIMYKYKNGFTLKQKIIILEILQDIFNDRESFKIIREYNKLLDELRESEILGQITIQEYDRLANELEIKFPFVISEDHEFEQIQQYRLKIVFDCFNSSNIILQSMIEQRNVSLSDIVESFIQFIIKYYE